MSKTYELSVLLRGDDQLSGKLSKSLAMLRELQKLSKGGSSGTPRSPGTSGNETIKDLRALREIAKLRGDNARAALAEGRAGASASLASLRVLREEVRLLHDRSRLRRTEAQTSSAGALADVRLMRERVKLLREEQKLSHDNRRGGRGSSFDGFNDTVRTGRNVATAARVTYDTIRGFTDPAVEQLRSRERFRGRGYSAAENARAFTAVDQTARSVKGVRVTDVQETLNSLVNALGGVDEAIRFLPLASKYRANMATLYGDQYGPADITRQTQNTFKALENLGLDRPTGRDAQGRSVFTREDQARMEKYFNIIAQATAATGGEINPNEFKLFTKYSRMAGQGLSTEGLNKLLPVIGQMGGASTGTALMTLYSNMVGGRIPVHKLGEWERMGLLDRSKVELNKQGQLKRLRPGAIPIADTLGEDPVGVADKLAEAFRGHGIDTSDFDQVNKQLMGMYGDRTGAGLMAQMINFRAAFEKESRNYGRALGVNETYAGLYERDNPLGQYSAFNAAQMNARAAAGIPNAQTGGAIAGYLTQAINDISGKATDNPAMAAATVGILSLGKASAEAAVGVGSFGSLFGGGNTGGGGSGIAGSGLDVSDVLTGGWAAGKGLKWLGMGAAPALPLVGALGYQQYALTGFDESNRGANHASSGYLKALQREREQLGGRLSLQSAQSASATALMSLNRGDQLKGAFGFGNNVSSFLSRSVWHDDIGGGRSRLYPYAAGGFRAYDPEAARKTFRDRAPELQFGEAMRNFLKNELPKLTPDAQTDVKKTLALEFPTAYREATSSLAQEMLNLARPAQEAGGALQQFFPPLNQSTGAITSMTGAALNFANRVNNLSFDPPPMSGVPSPPASPPSTAQPSSGPNRRSILWQGTSDIRSERMLNPVRGIDSPMPRMEVGSYESNRRRGDAGEDDGVAGGRVVHHHAAPNITVNVPPGSPAANSPRDLAKMIARELEIQKERGV